MSSVAIENIQKILSQEKAVARPSAEICMTISNLKDLCDIVSSGIDWRRQSTSPGSSAREPYKNQSGSPHTFARNSSSFSLSSSASEPSSSPRKVATPRYQSQFKNTAQPVEDKILNNIILSKMNKFCPGTYNDIRDFLYQILGSGDANLSEMTRQFMLLVFKKAAAEEIYCGLYAKLLSEISVRYSVIISEMQRLQENYLSMFDEIQEKEAGEEYQTFVEKNIEKKYRRGYSQFIAELTKLENISLPCLERIFTYIFEGIKKNAILPNKQTLIEEYIDCLLRMSSVFKNNASPFLVSAKKSLMALCEKDIDAYISKNPAYQSVSPKARFILMDVKDNLNPNKNGK
jgi:hypothetical protein